MRTAAPFFLILVLTAGAWAEAPQTMDLSQGWKFRPEPAGPMPAWQRAWVADADWAVLHAGRCWEEQGFANTDGFAWYRKEVSVPVEWAGRPVWLILGAVNDAFSLYCNAQPVNEFGDDSRHSVANIPSLANLQPFLKPGSRNVLALRVCDWGGSGGIWQPPCLLTVDETVIDRFPLLFGHRAPEANRIDAVLNLAQLGRNWNRCRAEFSLADASTDRILRRTLHTLSDDPAVLRESFIQPSAVPCRLIARLFSPDNAVVLERSLVVEPQADSARNEPGLKVLNNFVTELLRRPLQPAKALTAPFYNPREGWIFFALPGLSDKVKAEVDQRVSIQWRLDPLDRTPEAMLYLARGTHTLQLNGLESGELIIRAVPEIIFSQYPSTPHLEPFGPYDWEFLTRHVLSQVNTLVTGDVPDHLEEWRAEGRKWLVHASLPGLGDKTPPPADQVYNAWASNPGVTRPEFGGIIVDEFMLASSAHYQPWTEAMVRLHQLPGFSTKRFYAYCNDLFQNPYLPAFSFSQTLLFHNGRFALERYLPLPATEAEAYAQFDQEFRHAALVGGRQLPGFNEHLVVVLGYLSDPPEMLNRLPQVNYKAFIDMQLHFLATDPAMNGLFGIQEYLSSYADEEVLRWAHRLFRHYCIEGKRTRFTSEPYLLPHIKNSDFLDGMEGWRAEPAESGAVKPGKLEGFSWLQGRYPRIAQGDQGMLFKRSSRGPNRLRQRLQALQPGHWYSIKLISADVRHLEVKQTLGLAMELDRVRLDSTRSFHYVFPSNYAHTFGPYHAGHPAWINYQRIVFQALEPSAELTISDWRGDTPGGPAGQEILFNFIEVKPYFKE
ncbi:MAG TPA: hypothetical protein PK843_14195 [bacterium]|nr:hypothetical protein [bacterium]